MKRSVALPRLPSNGTARDQFELLRKIVAPKLSQYFVLLFRVRNIARAKLCFGEVIVCNGILFV